MPDQDELHLRVPRFFRGVIIGPNGNNIQSLCVTLMREKGQGHEVTATVVDDKRPMQNGKRPRSEFAIVKISGHTPLVTEVFCMMRQRIQDRIHSMSKDEKRNNLPGVTHLLSLAGPADGWLFPRLHARYGGWDLIKRADDVVAHDTGAAGASSAQ